MIEYVSGLMFSNDRRHVWLLQKQKGPEYLIGRWNGPGGKVDRTVDHSYEEAMVREWREETGMDTDVSHWENFVTLTTMAHSGFANIESVVRFFRAFVDYDEFKLPRTAETELVRAWSVNHDLPEMHQVGTLARNLPVLVALALDQSGLFLPIELKDGLSS